MFRSSFARSIGPTLSQVVRQPGWIATALSIGVHGLLWGVLPILPSSFLAEEADDQRTVGVVELSPEELARVPDFSTPSLELPPLSESDLYSLTPVPNQAPPSQLFPPFPPFSPDLYPSYEPPPGPPATRQTPSTFPSTSVSPSPMPSASPSPSPSPGTVAPTNPGVARNPDLDNLTGRAGTGSSPVPEDNPRPQDNRTAEQRLQDSIAQRRAAIARLGADSSGTTQEEARTTFVEWFETQVEEGADSEWKSMEIAAVYPAEACPLEVEPAAVYGVVVDNENKLVGEPKLVQSSGYQLFNQKALETVATYEFENESDANQVYVVTVKFDHTAESCQAPAPQADEPPAG
ncbi:hypothetical protein H6G00_10575 [Leptolyngbya sp. FACHB-541]|uniref:hypothetical protein n=1 Tax=Leptolyngbya sp. FACHB-541 TaxID=2692810 RepID=UPI00168935F1|nr:hypothetical protein [Leptolyngbya sp. FACHB-541]MBD1997064.1 hypothetical protein [Leptolyngbya sp. FACHB-541]